MASDLGDRRLPMSGTTSASETHTTPWRDHGLPIDERVEDLLGRMTLEEKVAQLYSMWVGAVATGDDFAPHQHDLTDETLDWHEAIRAGLGQITRPIGTAPAEPSEGARVLARMQSDIVTAGRFGIPAIAHEECLTGFMAWRATVYPTPLAWGATFDPELVERMGAAIGASLRRVGAHQGLAPVLDVIRDPRWGRTEEAIGEDPYLVATVGTAYVRGMQSAGIIATLKHFAGYSGSRAARNFAPVGVGPREFTDVYLLPFEMAIRDGGAGSVMHSYAEIDGVPAAANADLLTSVLRDGWGFDGTVVSDYFGVSFLQTLHQVAATAGQAAGLALAAGVDVELPAVRCFGAPLLAALKDGAVPESLVDRAARRVLRQKAELGLLDPDWTPTPPGLAGTDTLNLDSAADRALARAVAEESVVVLANDGVLPLRPEARLAVVGPQADNIASMLGCYTFPSHVGSQHPGLATGVEIPTLLAALKEERAETATGPIEYEPGCDVDGTDTSRIAAAAAVAREADVCLVVLGDRAGLFGNGTSGEGCDVADLRLPGVQADLLDAVLATGAPVVLVLLAGRPYALGAYTDRVGAIVQGFFPGEEGGTAVAGVLTGRVCPSGRLPVSVPRSTGGQPWTYLAPMLGHRSEVSTIDPTPAYPFGHGLSYTAFAWDDVRVDGRPANADEPVPMRTDSAVSVSLTVRNTGDRAGAEVVQLYLHDPVAQVTRPVQRLIGYARVALDAGEARRVSFDVAADLTSFTGLNGRQLVEPGDIELRLGASGVDIRHTVAARLTGPERVVDRHRRMVADVTVTPSQRA
jgi:beta-xylosidase